jgi:hypothetical protein
VPTLLCPPAALLLWQQASDESIVGLMKIQSAGILLRHG